VAQVFRGSMTPIQKQVRTLLMLVPVPLLVPLLVLISVLLLVLTPVQVATLLSDELRKEVMPLEMGACDLLTAIATCHSHSHAHAHSVTVD